MSKDQSGGEGGLEGFKGLAGFIIEIPWDTFTSETSERNDNGGVVWYEASVKISKTQEGLNILDFLRFWPIFDSFDLGGIHFETIF